LLQRRAASVASDIYSLGVIAYECLSGVRPFEGESLPELSIRVADGSYTPLEERAPEVPRALAAAVQRAMHREPGERYPSARAFGEALLRSRGAKQPEAHTTLAALTEAENATGRTRPPPATVAARTERPPATTPAAPASRRGWPIALLAAVLALGAYWWSRAASSTHAAAPTATVSAEALRQSQPTASSLVHSPPEIERAPQATSEPSLRPPPTVRSAAPASSASRSNSHQLSNENPY
jgi:serine/threonine-protein kinase